MDAGMAECLYFDFAGLPGVAAKTGVNTCTDLYKLQLPFFSRKPSAAWPKRIGYSNGTGTHGFPRAPGGDREQFGSTLRRYFVNENANRNGCADNARTTCRRLLPDISSMLPAH
jgi:hypothetical protein